MIQFDTSIFIDIDWKTVKHINTGKSWRGVSKNKFYIFSMSSRCRMGYRQIPVNRNLIQIHAQILNFISSNSSCTDRHTWSIHPASQFSMHFSLHVRIVSKWNISTAMCIVSTPPPFHAKAKIALLSQLTQELCPNNVINMHILWILTKNAIILYQKSLLRLFASFPYGGIFLLNVPIQIHAFFVVFDVTFLPYQISSRKTIYIIL